MKSIQFNSRSRTTLALIALAAAIVFGSSGRTPEGFGRDLQKVGNKISNEAGRHG